MEQYPIDAWPTLLVIEPGAERVVARWIGSADVDQVLRLALDGEKAIRADRSSRADRALVQADQLLAARRHGEAVDAYRAALSAGGPGWPSAARAAETLVQAASLAADPARCAEAARDVLPTLRSDAASGSRARVIAAGLSCAAELGAGGARQALFAAFEPDATRALADRRIVGDDRSSLYQALAEARTAEGDAAAARAIGLRWLADVEREAAAARTPVERSGLDGQRLSAAIQAGTPERALAALLASERDLPGEFTPAAYLASLYLRLDRPRDARDAAGRALERAQGPRRIRVLVLRARAERALGDAGAARASLEQAVQEGNALPPPLRPGALRDAAAMLREMGPASAPD